MLVKYPNQLEDARNSFHDKNIIAFLGQPKSGKTVVFALLKHALFNHFIPKRSKEFNAIVTSGQTLINKILGDMIKKQLFPPITRPIDRPIFSIEIHKIRGKGPSEIELILNDMSGENHMDYLVNEYGNPDDRLEHILTLHSSNNPFGPLSYLIFSKIYVIIIDCTESQNWEHEQSEHALVIQSLYEIQKSAKLTRNDKIISPLAIIFTKADKLNEKDRLKKPKELMDKMPEFESSLSRFHSGTIDYFKMSLDVEPESEDDVEKRIKHEQEYAKHNFDIEEESRKSEIQQRIDNEINEARECVKEHEDWSSEQIDAYVEDVKNKVLTDRENQFQPNQFEFEPSNYNTSMMKVKEHLHYSSDEYVRFILWILHNVSS